MKNRRTAVLILLALGAACARASAQVPTRDSAARRDPIGRVAAPPAESAAAFDRADRRARAVITHLRCAQYVGGLRQRLAFGPLDSLGSTGQCTVADGRFVGVFFDADTAFTGVSRFTAVDLDRVARRAAPLDTAGILAVERASSTAQLRGVEAFEKADRQYAPVAFRFDADTIEVWLLPAAVLTGRPWTVGGERGYVFSPDGRRLVREIDAFDAQRTIPLPDTGMVAIPSRERVVPGLTEMVLANFLHGMGRRVAIDLPGRRSMLVGEGSRAVWVHVPLKD